MNDISTFRALAERCFQIKPELRPPIFKAQAGYDDLAAWALLVDLRRIIVESEGTRCNYAEVCTRIAAVPLYEPPHEAIARCWLAANGVQA